MRADHRRRALSLFQRAARALFGGTLAQRRHDACHPLQVGAMVAINLLAVMQVIYGPRGSKVLLTLGTVEQKMFAMLLILGSASCLMSLWLREPTGAYFERGGLLGVWIGLWVFTLTLADTTAWWQTTLGLGFFGVGAGCLYRAAQVHVMIRRDRRART